MKLKGTTLFLLLGAIALSGVVYLFEDVHQAQQAEQAQQQKLIFQFTEADITGFTIAVADELLVFERDPNQPETEQWAMKAPEVGRADAATVEFLTNLLVKGERQRTFLANVDNLDTYGLADPLATLTINLNAQPEPQVLRLGGLNFDQKFLYAQINPEAQSDSEQEILVVPIELKYAVERQPKEWLTLDAQDENAE